MEPEKPQQRNVHDLYNMKAMKEFDLGNVDFDFDFGFNEKEAEHLQKDIQRLEEEERQKAAAQQKQQPKQ